MQTYLNVRAMNVGNDTAQSARGTDLSRAIPAGRDASATVLQVSQNQSQPGQFILQLRVGNQTIELASARPFPQGSQVLLSRDAQGNIQLQLPANNAPATTSDATRLQNAPAQARAEAEALLLRISSNSSQQAVNLPINQTQRGIILAQPQTTTANGSSPAASANQTAAPSSSSSSGSNSNQVMSGSTIRNTPAQNAASSTSSATLSTSGTAAPSSPSTTAPSAAIQSNTGLNNTSLNTTATNTTTTATTSATNTAASTGNQNTATTNNTAANNPTINSPQTSNISANPANTSTLVQTTSAQMINQIPAPTPVATATINNPTPPQGSATQSTPTTPSTATQQTTANTSLPQGSATVTTNSITPPTTPLSNLINSNDAGNRPQGFPVRVLVAGQVIDLVSPRPIQSGQQVDVTRNEQGLVRIQFTQPATPLAQQAAVQAVMQQALREVLPVQLPLADGLNQLMQISERQGARQNNALNQLIQSMLGLFSVKPGAADADKAIARNLQQGGLLSEAGLSKTGQQPAPDLKQQLGQLLKVAEQLPRQAREQLNQLVNSLLARSTAQQISSLQGWRDLPDGGQERHYRLDLPIQQQKGFENAELRITEHRRRNEEGEFVTLWSVKLHFELEQDGAVDAELSLQDRFQLNANFWVEKPETLTRLRERLNSFEQELKTKGFDVAPLNARLGKLANPEITPLSKRLVDVHT